MCRLLVFFLGALGSMAAALGVARAEPPGAPLPSVAVLRTEAPGDDGTGLGGAIERLVRARLTELDVVEVEGTPGLGLPDLQLAVGCVGETAECLGAVAAQLEVDALVMSTVDQVGDELVLTLTFFREGNPKTVTSRTRGERAESALLGEVENAVRALFELPPVEPAPVVATDARRETTNTPKGGLRDTSREEETKGPSPVPFTVAAAGLGGIAAGIAFGLKSQDTEDEYGALPTTTEEEVRKAQKTLDDAEKEARIANVSFAAGGALVAISVVLFVVMRPDGGDTEQKGGEVAIRPAILKRGGGIALTGRFRGVRTP